MNITANKNQPKSVPTNNPANVIPKNQNNSFSRNHTIGTRNINIKTIKNILINLPITFSFKYYYYLFYIAKIQLFPDTAKIFCWLFLLKILNDKCSKTTCATRCSYLSNVIEIKTSILPITKSRKNFLFPNHFCKNMLRCFLMSMRLSLPKEALVILYTIYSFFLINISSHKIFSNP